MEQEFHFTGRELIANGWDGDFNTLEEFKWQLKAALELGWNPKEMTMMQFYARLSVLVCGTLAGTDVDESILKPSTILKPNNIEKKNEPSPKQEEKIEPLIEDDEDEEPSYEERRRRALEMGWDEEEMDLEEFEDYYM